MKEKGFRITTDPPTLSSILQLTPDDEVVFIILLEYFWYYLYLNLAVLGSWY